MMDVVDGEHASPLTDLRFDFAERKANLLSFLAASDGVVGLMWGRQGFDGIRCGRDGKPRSVWVNLVNQARALTITGEEQLALAA